MPYSGFVQAIADVVRPELGLPAPLELQERDPGGRHDPMRIGCRDDVLALSFDQCFEQLGRPASHVGEWLFPTFRSGRGLRESCDYVLFHQRGDTLWILLVELKSLHSGTGRDQILNTRLLIDHLLSVVMQRSGYAGDPPGQLRYRGIVFNEKCAPLKTGPRGEFIYQPDSRMPDVGLATIRRRSFYHVDAFCA